MQIGLRVHDLERSCALYERLGFHRLTDDEQPNLRHLALSGVGLILSSLSDHGFHAEQSAEAARSGPLGAGVVLVLPTVDLDAAYKIWLDEGLRVTLPPEEVQWARVFYGLDPDGYELMFEQLKT